MILLTPKEFILYLEFRIGLAEQKKDTIKTCGYVDGDDITNLSETDGMIKAYQDIKDHMVRTKEALDFDRQWGMMGDD